MVIAVIAIVVIGLGGAVYLRKKKAAAAPIVVNVPAPVAVKPAA